MIMFFNDKEIQEKSLRLPIDRTGEQQYNEHMNR